MVETGFACKGFTGFSGILLYKVYRCIHGVDDFNDKKDLIANNLLLSENRIGAHLMVTRENPHNLYYKNIHVYSIARTDCDSCYSQTSSMINKRNVF